jgi:hypothetical protein
MQRTQSNEFTESLIVSTLAKLSPQFLPYDASRCMNRSKQEALHHPTKRRLPDLIRQPAKFYKKQAFSLPELLPETA